MDDARRYFERAREGYEELQGSESENVLGVTYGLTMATDVSTGEKIEKLRDLVKRAEGALEKQNQVTLETLNSLGIRLKMNGQYKESKKVKERCLTVLLDVLGEQPKKTLASLGNLGNVYGSLQNWEKALEYYERALKGWEKLKGKVHPSTLTSVMNIAMVYIDGLKEYAKAEEYCDKALKGFIQQLGTNHPHTKRTVQIYKNCLEESGNSLRLAELKEEYP